MSYRAAAGRVLIVLGLLFSMAGGVGCKGPAEVPDYARPLPPGQPALRLVTGERREAVLREAAQQLGDPAFIEALGRSADWFRLPSAGKAFPVDGITYDHARASVEALQQLTSKPPGGSAFQTLDQTFAVYESVGYNGRGVVLFTGYFSPQFTASYTRTGRYQYPLYARPSDLVTDPGTGGVLGRSAGGVAVEPYPTRREIEGGNLLAGSEFVWLPSRLDAYSIEVNGSAALTMTDGSTLYVGYAGTNGRDYTSIGRLLVADGKLDANTVSMPAIRRYFREHPGELDAYIQRNDRFVFFQAYDGTRWPAGSLGFKVTPGRTLATDKTVYPRGGAVLVSTVTPDGERFEKLMLDQDTGGAIRAPGRADIYFGVGADAEAIAGSMAAEGRLYYLFLKPSSEAADVNPSATR